MSKLKNRNLLFIFLNGIALPTETNTSEFTFCDFQFTKETTWME